MAQKAKKDLAVRNASKLNGILYAAIAIHSFYLLLRLLLGPFTRMSLFLYILFSAPGILIHIWFEKIGRPQYGVDGPRGGDLRKSGEDLEAKGLTEFLWDILYWTWGCIMFAAAFGDRMWWLYLAIPAYGGYLAYTTYTGARSGMAGLTGPPQQEEGSSSGVSKRQAKLEKRGGQRVAYR